jgi:hypothetical protein
MIKKLRCLTDLTANQACRFIVPIQLIYSVTTGITINYQDLTLLSLEWHCPAKTEA